LATCRIHKKSSTKRFSNWKNTRWINRFFWKSIQKDKKNITREKKYQKEKQTKKNWTSCATRTKTKTVRIKQYAIKDLTTFTFSKKTTMTKFKNQKEFLTNNQEILNNKKNLITEAEKLLKTNPKELKKTLQEEEHKLFKIFKKKPETLTPLDTNIRTTPEITRLQNSIQNLTPKTPTMIGSFAKESNKTIPQSTYSSSATYTIESTWSQTWSINHKWKNRQTTEIYQNWTKIAEIRVVWAFIFIQTTNNITTNTPIKLKIKGTNRITNEIKYSKEYSLTIWKWSNNVVNNKTDKEKKNKKEREEQERKKREEQEQNDIPTLSSSLEFSSNIEQKKIQEFIKIFWTEQPERWLIKETSKGKYERQLFRKAPDWSGILIWEPFICDRNWELEESEIITIYTLDKQKIKIKINDSWKISKVIWTTETLEEIQEQKKKIKELFSHNFNWPRKNFINNDTAYQKILNTYSKWKTDIDKDISWPDINNIYTVKLTEETILNFKIEDDKLKLVGNDKQKKPVSLTEHTDNDKIKKTKRNWDIIDINEWIFFNRNWKGRYINITKNNSENENEITLMECWEKFKIKNEKVKNIISTKLYNKETFNLQKISVWKHFKATPWEIHFKKTKWTTNNYELECFENEWKTSWQNLMEKDTKIKFKFIDKKTVDITETNKQQTNIEMQFDRNFVKKEMTDTDLNEVTNQKISEIFEINKQKVSFKWQKIYNHAKDPRYTSWRTGEINIEKPTIEKDEAKRKIDIKTDNKANKKIEKINWYTAEIINKLQIIKNLTLWDNDEAKLDYWNNHAKNERFWDNNWPLWKFKIKDNNISNYIKKKAWTTIFQDNWEINIKNIRIERKVKTTDDNNFTLKFKLAKIDWKIVIDKICTITKAWKEAIEKTNWKEHLYVAISSIESDRENLEQYNVTIDEQKWTISFTKINDIETDNKLTEDINKIKTNDLKNIFSLQSKQNLILDWHDILKKLINQNKTFNLPSAEKKVLEQYLTFMKQNKQKNKKLKLINLYIDPDQSKQTDARNEFKTKFWPELLKQDYKIIEKNWEIKLTLTK